MDLEPPETPERLSLPPSPEWTGAGVDHLMRHHGWADFEREGMQSAKTFKPDRSTGDNVHLRVREAYVLLGPACTRVEAVTLAQQLVLIDELRLIRKRLGGEGGIR